MKDLIKTADRFSLLRAFRELLNNQIIIIHVCHLRTCKGEGGYQIPQTQT